MTLTYTKTPRIELVAQLRVRDGENCQHPKCGKPLNHDAEGQLETTIDHWYPQYWCREQGWTMEEIWALPNLKLMHKKCNAYKGDLVPNEDGTLPEKKKRTTFRNKREKRATRPELCEACDNGHNLMIDEICASCGCDAQRFPREAKVRYQDCDHEVLWCWICSITPDMRPSSVGTAMRQADSSAFGEILLDD